MRGSVSFKLIYVTLGLVPLISSSNFSLNVGVDLFQTASAGEILRFKSGNVPTARFYDSGPLDIKSDAIATQAEQAFPRYYVLQFKKKIGRDEQREMASQGLKVFRYIPDDALVVEVKSQDRFNSLQKWTKVRALLPYLGDWKISSELKSKSNKPSDDIEIQIFQNSDMNKIVNDLKNISGLTLVTSSQKNIMIRLNDYQKISDLAEIEGIEWIQKPTHIEFKGFNPMDDISGPAGPDDGESKPPQDPPSSPSSDPTQPKQTYSDLNGFESGTKIMNFESAWSRGLHGEGQVAAMADTGLDTGDLQTIAGDFKGRNFIGQFFGLFASGWEDSMGHGTHVAGSIVGNGAPSGGILRGGAYEAAFVAQSMWSPLLENLMVPPKIADMLIKAYDEGARVHSNSWGSSRSLGQYDAFASQVDEFIHSHPDFLVLFAAGNSGIDKNKDGRIDAGSVSSPGTAKNVLTVGASENFVANGGIQKRLKELKRGQENWGVPPLADDLISNNPNGIACFSSRGPTQDGRTKPEIVAPGTNILSTRSHQEGASELWGAFNEDYVWSGGTSMATPLAAGAATVTRQYLVRDKNIANPSAALVKAVMMESAIDLYPGQFGEIGQAAGQELLTHRPNSDQGFGRVDVSRSTAYSEASLVIDDGIGVSTGEAKNFSFQLTADAHMTAVLVWTDAAGSPSVAKSLVNDLDLVLVDATGQETRLSDNVNNNEIMEKDLTSGAYQIQVRGANVPQGINGKQPFALIVRIP